MNFIAYASKHGLNKTGCSVDGVVTIGGIQCIIESLLGFIPPFLALAAVFMIIFSGARMIMAGDNPKALESARKTLTFAIIGLVGIGLAWVILVLIEQFTGAPVTKLQFLE